MSPALPERLGRYAVEDLIGVGAFATVFRARDDRLDTEVALKVLAENHSFDPDLRERFVTEGHLLRRVANPHVVTVFDLDETAAGRPFLVLELAVGGDLRRRRQEVARASVGPDEVVEVASQVADALSALHAQRVVHRDVSPANLLIAGSPTDAAGPADVDGTLLRTGERLALADLGLSKDLAVASGLTVGAGTAGFTPPEQGEGGWIDPRADIWSASALLVWVALGRPPDPDRRWRTELAGRGWPAPLVEALSRGLAADVDERQGTVGEWEAALHEAVAPAAGPAPAPGRVGAGTSETGHRRLRSLVAGVAVTLLAAAALVGIGWYVGHEDGGPGRAIVEHLGGGQQRISARDGDVTVTATSPEVVAVGGGATYRATVRGTDHYAWLAPDGQIYADEPTVVVRPTSSGTTSVTLIASGQAAIRSPPRCRSRFAKDLETIRRRAATQDVTKEESP